MTLISKASSKYRCGLILAAAIACCFGWLASSQGHAQSFFNPRGSFSGRTSTGASSTPLSTRAGRTSDTGGLDLRTDNAQDDAYFTQYEGQLNAILKTRRNEERDFVAGIVEQIRAGELTTRIVNTSFKWVKSKRPNINYPFVYFERVLRLLAEKQGVADAVPPFDRDIYSTLPLAAQRGGVSSP